MLRNLQSAALAGHRRNDWNSIKFVWHVLTDRDTIKVPETKEMSLQGNGEEEANFFYDWPRNEGQ